MGTWSLRVQDFGLKVNLRSRFSPEGFGGVGLRSWGLLRTEGLWGFLGFRALGV